MNRRDFLNMAPMAMAGYLASCTQKEERVNPERQSPTSLCGRGIAEIARSIRIVRDIPFAKRPGRELHLDVYAPKVDGMEPWPAILSFGTAAWRTQSKEIRPDLEHLSPSPTPTPTVYLPVMVPRGFVVVNAECRVAREARFPAQIQDCKCAVQWVRAHAQQFHIDPNRIGVAGGSSDGHLAALLAVTNSKDGLDDENCYPGYSSRVQAAFCFAGFFDFEYYQTVPGDGTLQAQINVSLGGTYQEIPAVYRQASPTHYVTSDDPPFLLMHGLQDKRVPYEQTVHFAKC